MPGQRFASLLLLLLVTVTPVRDAGAFGFFDGTGAGGLQRGSRWDSRPRTLGGFERSLAGGIRFSLEGGSYSAYRDLLTWEGAPPSPAEFEQAVLDAFATWTTTDPATGLDSIIRFVPDLGTPVSGSVSGFVRAGAEIDIMASTNANGWNPGNSSIRAETLFSSIGVSGNLTLTSGVTNYPGFAISGADITFNSNPQARYTLVAFRTILAHEIGHALGLADVDATSGPGGTFIDDNFDGRTSATASATLTNVFAHLVDPANPGASPLSAFFVANADPGLDSPGADIFMESTIPSQFFVPGVRPRLLNDDYAGRQFLYPVALPPTLTVAQDGTDIILSWDDAPGWQAYTSGGLGGDWTPTASQGSVSDGVRTVEVARTAGTHFFRLERFHPDRMPPAAQVPAAQLAAPAGRLVGGSAPALPPQQ